MNNPQTMKTIFLKAAAVAAACSLCACSGYDDTPLANEVIRLRSEMEALMSENDSLKHEDDCVVKSFCFDSGDNAGVLSRTVYGVISDTVINVRIPEICLDKHLVPRIEFANENCFIESPSELTDFNSPATFCVANGMGKRRTYVVNVSSYTGLPMLFVYTDGSVRVESKDYYVRGALSIYTNTALTRAFAEPTDSMWIKGRGNSTWTMPKKPYQIKLDSKKEMLGMPKDKTWLLLANYTDKSFLRWETACDLSRMSCLGWTPRTRFVELFMNDVYQGTYVLCEKIKIADDRVDVGDDGYVLEIDQLSRMEADDLYFETDRILCNIKDPDLDYGDESYVWIKDYVTQAERALFGDDFLDKEKGYKNYVDIESFADWYLINEIAKNNDATFFSSCYMNIRKGGKLKMGPIWDFDIAFGNCNYNGNWDEEGFWVRHASWISRMFDDPDFIALVKERYKMFYNRKDDILQRIGDNASMLHYSVQENDNVWHTLYTATWPNYSILGAYDNETAYLKAWIAKRMEWLKNAIEEL